MNEDLKQFRGMFETIVDELPLIGRCSVFGAIRTYSSMEEA